MYSARWAMNGQVLSVRRELVTAFDVAVCAGALRRELAVAMAEIRRDHRAKVVLNEP